MRWLGFTILCRPRLTDSSADGRARQGSHSAMESLNPALRSGTLASLPPYSSSSPDWAGTESLQHAKTPADLLDIGNNHKRKTSDPGTLDFHLEPDALDAKGICASLHSSPNTLGPLTEPVGSSDLDSEEAMKLLGRRRNTIDQIATPPTGLGISNCMSEGSSAVFRAFTSPTNSSPRTSTTEATSSSSGGESTFSLESAVLETVMDNLNGVQASYYKAKSRISYLVSTIESFRNTQTGRRYIIISPPPSSNIVLYFGMYRSCPLEWSIN